MKALVIGLGSIGRRHARNLHALGVGVAGVDPAAHQREAFVAEVPGSEVYSELESGLRAHCEVAIVASPNVCHAEQARACAAAGLHLFIEKPLAVDLDGIQDLAADVARRRLMVLLGSNWKFHPGPLRLKELIERGELGRVVAVQAVGGQYLPDWHPWEDYRRMYSSRRDLGGGVLLDSHDLDYLTWLLGPLMSIACRVISTGALDIETCDLACLLLAFSSGAMGTLQLDYLQRPYARRVHLTGTDGTAIWDHTAGAVREYRAATKSWTETLIPADYDINDMYVSEMRHFLECVRGNVPTVTPLDQAVHVLTALERARASSMAGGGLMAVA